MRTTRLLLAEKNISSKGLAANVLPNHRRTIRRLLGQTRTQALFIVAFLVVSFFLALYLQQDMRAYTIRYKLDSLEQQRQLLRSEISQLQYELAMEQSLARIEERARRLGLIENTEVELLPVDRPANTQGRDDRQVASVRDSDASQPSERRLALPKLLDQFAAWLVARRVTVGNSP